MFFRTILSCFGIVIGGVVYNHFDPSAGYGVTIGMIVGYLLAVFEVKLER
jgi:hypothetical protein